MSTPGAATSILGPKLLNPASWSQGSTADTVTTSGRLAGTKPRASALELPAAATITAPRLCA
jgi:hypothetical protein